MTKRPAKVQFNGGELSPWLWGRIDIAKYHQTAKLCRNFIPLTEGCLKRRGGTRFVAQTPEDDELRFEIAAVPEDAEVYINGTAQKKLMVARGDSVTYEVSAKGYASMTGEMIVTQNTKLEACLVSLSEVHHLTIIPLPLTATVKIGNVYRREYVGFKNERVSYTVFKDGYILKSGTVLLNEDVTLRVNLEQDTGEDAEYGDWGEPVSFVSVTAYGQLSKKKKCFLIRFENGYLPILFDAAKKAPEEADIDESLFVYTETDGYNAFCLDKNKMQRLAVIRKTSQGVFYDDVDGTVIVGFDNFSLVLWGWRKGLKGKIEVVYSSYDGIVAGHIVKVYEAGKLVWILKGRNNG